MADGGEQLPSTLTTSSTDHQSTESTTKVNNETNEHVTTKFSHLPARMYLDQTVVSILLQGMSQLARQRPSKPIEYLISFLMENKEKYGE